MATCNIGCRPESVSTTGAPPTICAIEASRTSSALRMLVNSWAQDFREVRQGAMLESFDRAHILAHHLARLFEVEAEHQSVQHHVALILRELRQGIGNLVEPNPLIDGVQRIGDAGRWDVTGFELRMAVLSAKSIHDFGVCDFEEPTDELALGPATKTSDGLQRGEVNILEEVLSRGLLADARQEVAKDSAVRGIVELGKGVPILLASPGEPFDVPRGWVFIVQCVRHLESRHAHPWRYGLNETVTTF